MSKELSKEEIVKLAEQNANNYNEFAKSNNEWQANFKGFIKGYEHSDQNTKPLIDEITKLKDSNDRYKQDYSECQLLLKKQLDEVVKLKASKSESNEAVEFAAYLSVNNWESSNGIMYNKFRMEYGSKYIINTEHINKLYETFKTRNNK